MSRVSHIRTRLATATSVVVAGGVLVVVPPGPGAVAAGTWSPVEDLGAEVERYNDDRDPAVVQVRRNRTAVAAWVAGDDETPGPVTVSLRAASGGWTMPQAVSPDLPGDATYALDVAGGALASVVWERKVGGVWRIEETHLDGGTWATPVQVGRGRHPETVVDGTGATTVAWSNAGLRVARRTASGAWSPPQRVAGGAVSGVELAANPDGDVAVAWTGAYRRVRAAVRPRGAKAWRAPATLGKGPYVTSVQVAVNRRGRALVLWTITGIWNEAKRDYQNPLAWARSTPRGTWSATRTLTRQLGEDGGAVELSMNPGGGAVAAWTQIDRSDSPTLLWTARFRRNGTWTAPTRVSRTNGSAHPVWLDGRGTAHLLSNRGGGMWHFSQRPGAGWQATEVDSGRVLTAHGTDRRLVLLFRTSTLRSRTLDVP